MREVCSQKIQCLISQNKYYAEGKKLGIIQGRGGGRFWTLLLPLTMVGDYDLFKTLNYAIKLQRYKV